MSYIYRIAKTSDAKRIAQIHANIKDVNSLGIFVLMGGAFLRQYYRLVLSDPYSVCVCAENFDGRIDGFAFALLDSKKHHKYLMKHKFGLAASAIGTLLIRPMLLKQLFLRYKSLENNDGTYATQEGVRNGYWGWDPDHKDIEGAMSIEEHIFAMLKVLGVKDSYGEVDIDNPRVLKYVTKRASIVEEVTLPDGRRRAVVHTDVENYKFHILRQFNNK